jgi:hypothetical protein
LGQDAQDEGSRQGKVHPSRLLAVAGHLGHSSLGASLPNRSNLDLAIEWGSGTL